MRLAQPGCARGGRARSLSLLRRSPKAAPAQCVGWADVAAALRATPAIAFDGKNSRARASARGPRTHTQRRWPYALAPCLKNIAMPRLIDHHASRVLAYRTRAIELAQQAKREDDPGQRRYLLDLARNMVNVADALAPPDEPQLFRTAKEAGARAKENGGS